MRINISYSSIMLVMSTIQCDIITWNIMNYSEMQYVLFTLSKWNYNQYNCHLVGDQELPATENSYRAI